ncbi:Sec-independent protein translocase subunit TatA [Kitasatospora purpeofusca]|uniref:Sec-independent protein translocase subunit TatA n=1 Tax=Kitasatospora purpeofusca TaxID=67352 RepID=UPI00224D201D|nr:Sec-independent protein translocase subunit TatA [Kitasatospora purpeofusca]MCX4682883.1 Sec-independent protein translocase subunit TatA [Kitasatospora purpeofusca]
MLRNGLEPWHLIVVLAVIVLLFGSKKLPEAARGLGKSLRILKAETRALHEDTPPDPAPDTPTDNSQNAPTAHTAPETTTPAIPPPRTDAPAGGRTTPSTSHSHTPS